MSESDIIRRLEHIEVLLKGDPRNRDDGGVVGDMREVKRTLRRWLWWTQFAGGILLTAGAGAAVARLFGGG